jgi:YaiO family outer membrane protein
MASKGGGSLIRTIVVFLSFALFVQAQDRFDPDELFRQARTLGFDGKREEARQLCRRILDQYPDYTDVRVFLGRLQSWDGQYDEARRTLLQVLTPMPGDKDARIALIDVELSSNNSDRALQYSDTGLQSAPADEGFLYKKAQALNNLKRPREAAEVLERILDRNPSNKEARSLMTSLEEGSRLYRFNVDYGYESLSSIAPWHSGSASLSRESGFGTVVGRFNYAKRFDNNGYQVEVDAYPGLREGLYTYLNYGYSDTALFPKHRVGLELFSNAGKGFELSAGFRYLHFADDVWIYTGTAGKYFGNYFASVRPFVTPGRTGTSLSSTWMLRRYFSGSDSYLGLSVGGGSAPDDALSTVDLERLNSFRIAATGSLPVRRGVYLKFNVGWATEELPANRDRRRLTFGTGFTRRF